MLLQELLEGIENGPRQKQLPCGEIGKVTSDSRRVCPGDVFVAIEGPHEDGHIYLRSAAEKGAILLIAQKGRGGVFECDRPVLLVANSRQFYQQILLKYHRNVLKQLKLIGITGTNGKTTTAYLIQYLLNKFSSCGMMGTIEHIWAGNKLKAKNTTPGLEDFLELLSKMAGSGVKYCVSEVSSHALDQGRVGGLKFEVALFTNLTQDHLDYHQNLENYFEAKRKLFISDSAPTISIINTDDAYGKRLSAQLNSENLISFGRDNQPAARIHNVEASLPGSRFDLEFRGKKYCVKSPLPLLHNSYNVTGALLALQALGYPLEEVVPVLESFPGVPGRMQRVDAGQLFDVFIDYAHTPDAFQNVLSFVKPHVRARLICVFGCGGNRDRLKRPMMGRIAAQFSDRLFLTNDNPRKEFPQDILNDILSGIGSDCLYKVSKTLDREKAICEALAEARAGDVVLILGKGHETEQIIGADVIHFNDYEIAQNFLSRTARNQA